MSAEILARTPLTPRQHELASTIIRGSDRMARMVHDLLDFTRTRLGANLVITSERCDIGEICRNIAGEFRSGRADRDVSLLVEGHCVGEWDCERIAQLMSNLIGNAIQHGFENTPVSVTVTGSDPDRVTVSVVNHGPLIPPERRVSIFDPLTRGPDASQHSQGGSLGLGLYIVREIALAHGGDVALASSDDAGTVFQLWLPRVAVRRRERRPAPYASGASYWAD
jgi:signal transduction histidine kinase